MHKKLKILLSIIFLFLGVTLQAEPQTIAIIGAMDVEVAEIAARLQHPKTYSDNHFNVTTGVIGPYKIVLAKSGVGKVNAAIMTQFLIDHFHPHYLINVGIAGSLDRNIKVGHMLLINKAVQHDFDLTAFGYAKGYIPTNGNAKQPTFYEPTPADLLEFYTRRLSELLPHLRVQTGTIVSGDVFVHKKSDKRYLRRTFKAVAVDMESAAIAQTAQANGVPLVILRTISDKENDSAATYIRNEKDIAQQAADALATILEN